jgi:hypothetical protein
MDNITDSPLVVLLKRRVKEYVKAKHPELLVEDEVRSYGMVVDWLLTEAGF